MRVEFRDSLEFLFADTAIGATPCHAAQVDVARGGIASIDLLLNDLPVGRTLDISLRRNGRRPAEAKWFRLVDVPVEVNTGPVGFIEKKGEENAFVTRRAPFRVYDAMAPVSPRLRTRVATMVLRLQMPVATNAAPGQREYQLEVSLGKEAQSLCLAVEVHRPVIPPVGADSLPYTNWFSLGLMAERHALEPWSEAHWRMIRRYADLMAHGRQNTFWFTLGDVFTLQRGAPVLNRQRLRRLVKTFTAAGMYFIEGAHVASRGKGGWDTPVFTLSLAQVPATSDQGNVALAAIAGQFMEEIERHSWQERWLQHVADEPISANAADYRILVGMVRKYMPGLPIIDATLDPALTGSVDIWCPQAQEYQKDRERFDGYRGVGDRIWYYTCCFPGGPWLNRLLDQELLRPALFGWGAARYDLHGFLHWGLNHYRHDQDPFEQSVVDHGGGNHLPAGDTHIIYPGAGRPYSSVRLEAQREGLEDYELLRLLQRRDPKAAARVIRRAFRRFDDYTKSAKTFRAARRALLEALSS